MAYQFLCTVLGDDEETIRPPEQYAFSIIGKEPYLFIL
jgi:hypothetical protein